MSKQSSRIAPGARRTGGVAAIFAAAALGLGVAGCSDEETQDAIDQAKEGLSTAQEEVQKGLDEAEKEAPQAKEQIRDAKKQAEEGIDDAQQKLEEQSSGGY